jgi:DNA polymerase-3 subunit epsilon
MYAIIDIETTGTSAANGKITEIAIFVHNGEKITESFATLINPECNIPWHITKLTGISNEMVEHAPKFYEVARRIVELTAGITFVAHNVSFDYSFVREEFKRLGYDYKRKTLCTVNLSRKLLPGHRSYSLGKLCSELGIDIEGRHRAAGDALATAKLFDLLLRKNEMGQKGLFAGGKSALSEDKIAQLPGKTGIYYFYDARGTIIYIGKSTNIHQRVLSHLNNMQTKKAVEMRDKIADIDYLLTGSELLALLIESDEIKQHKPLYNRAQRRTLINYGLFAEEDQNGYLNLKISRMASDEVPLTTFHFYQEAIDYLYNISEKYKLCRKLCHLEDGEGPCFNVRMGYCNGVCNGNESVESYNLRVISAISQLQFRSLNFFVIEQGRDEQEIAVVKVKNGRYIGLGYASIDCQHIDELSDSIKTYQHNRDTFNIINSYIRHNSKKIKLISY